MDTPRNKPQIIDLLKSNNPNGYELLCDNYSAIVYGSIMRMVNDTLIAEYLLKQTFQKVCKNIDDYKFSKLSFVSWALQLARSLSIEYLRHNKKNNSVPAVENAPSPGSVELVMLPLVNDTENCVDIFNMTIQGFKADEIAKKLNLGIDVVKAGIRRGMKLKANRIN